VALLDRTPLPQRLSNPRAGLQLPRPDPIGLTPIVVRFTTDILQYSVDADRATYSAQVAVVVRVRDAQSREVQKLSQQYTLSGEMKDLDAAKKGTILFYREPDLPPGYLHARDRGARRRVREGKRARLDDHCRSCGADRIGHEQPGHSRSLRAGRDAHDAAVRSHTRRSMSRTRWSIRMSAIRSPKAQRPICRSSSPCIGDRKDR
jgi:hypothetical protein